MAKRIVGVVAGLVVWVLTGTVAGVILRASWPAYAAVAQAMTFTLPMMIVRLSIGALATIAAGFVTAALTRSVLVGLWPGVLLLVGFIPEHISLWSKFPIWYHLTFLVTLVPLAYVGCQLAAGRHANASVHE